LRLAELRWIPVGNPGHRDPPLASAELRLEMLRVAIAGQPGFVLDDREISRGGVSYTIDTLSELRGEYPQRSLCLLLGMDAFASFTSWHRWQEIFAVAHVVVAHRPGWQAPTTGPLAALLAERGVAPCGLRSCAKGHAAGDFFDRLARTAGERWRSAFSCTGACPQHHSRVGVLCSRA
jgi:nicotinate-nucleotide adenylyltransferase